jgi:hypothetical protein
MRQEVIDYCQSISLGSFTVSSEIPFDDSGVPLYLKNAKRIYVDLPQYATDRLVSALDGLTVSNELATVRVVFSADAKSLPANYETLVSDLRLAKDITLSGVYRREVDVKTDFEQDMLVTELELRFTKLT